MKGKKEKILLVDDDERNLRLLEALLIPMNYEIEKASDGISALEKTDLFNPDLILLDAMMPKLNGFEVAKKLKEDENTMTIPIVMVTALQEVEDRVKALEAGADDFLSKPIDKTELKARVKSLLKVKAYHEYMKNYQVLLEKEVHRKTARLQKALTDLQSASLETIHILSRAAEYKDEETGAHTLRMSNYAAKIAREMGQKDIFIETLLYSSPMHDIGKIGIPDQILLKPGKLTPQEWKIMKRHTIYGEKILEGYDHSFIKMGKAIALNHHEKWNGSGYPTGVSGTDIPFEARISALADVFDALTSRRPYKEAFSLEKSFGIIREGKGKHFDPNVVDAFFACIDNILAIKEKYINKGESVFVSILKEANHE